MIWIVYGYRHIMCYIIAERRNRTVIVRSAPFTEEIWKAINIYSYTVIYSVSEYQFLARLFGLPVRIIKCGLS